jgi:hypothetical protein
VESATTNLIPLKDRSDYQMVDLPENVIRNWDQEQNNYARK